MSLIALTLEMMLFFSMFQLPLGKSFEPGKTNQRDSRTAASIFAALDFGRKGARMWQPAI
jgi:hypothetical protein